MKIIYATFLSLVSTSILASNGHVLKKDTYTVDGKTAIELKRTSRSPRKFTVHFKNYPVVLETCERYETTPTWGSSPECGVSQRTNCDFNGICDVEYNSCYYPVTSCAEYGEEKSKYSGVVKVVFTRATKLKRSQQQTIKIFAHTHLEENARPSFGIRIDGAPAEDYKIWHRRGIDKTKFRIRKKLFR